MKQNHKKAACSFPDEDPPPECRQQLERCTCRKGHRNLLPQLRRQNERSPSEHGQRQVAQLAGLGAELHQRENRGAYRALHWKAAVAGQVRRCLTLNLGK